MALHGNGPARAATTSEDLVPTGLPYGSRQQTVANMQAANIPLSSVTAGGSEALPGPATGPPTPPPAGPVNRQGLEQFDVFANREPTDGFAPIGGGDPTAVLQAQIAASPNSALRYYFGRAQEFEE